MLGAGDLVRNTSLSIGDIAKTTGLSKSTIYYIKS